MATYAFTDIHGNYELWKAIQSYIKEDDILFFLGDALDRGKDGIKIMQEMFNDKRVKYIIGNHEDIFLDFTEDLNKSFKEDLKFILHNGCLDSLKKFNELSKEEQESLRKNLKNNTYLKYTYINKKGQKIFLSHAGVSFNKLFYATPKDLLTDREHIKEEDFLISESLEDYIIVHGHTPVQFIKGMSVNSEIYYYCNNKKIDLDIATFTTHKIALLDLDTLEPIYFEGKEKMFYGC